MKTRLSSQKPAYSYLKLLSLAIFTFLAISATAAGQSPKQLTYKTVEGVPLHLYVFEPSLDAAATHRPALLLIHGGGWDHGRPLARSSENLARKFADMGFVTFALQYRLIPGWKDMAKQNESEKKAYAGVIAGENTVFDSVKDARSAMRYLRVHAGELRLAPDHIVAAGGSAGGHLASATTLFTGPDMDEPGEDTSISCAANALVLFNPVIDTSKAGYGNQKIGPRWKELSPVDHVRPGLPPTILFHSTGDKTTPFAGAQKFHNLMTDAGNIIEFHLHQGGGHGYISKDPALLESGLSRIKAFLQRQNILPALMANDPNH